MAGLYPCATRFIASDSWIFRSGFNRVWDLHYKVIGSYWFARVFRFLLLLRLREYSSCAVKLQCSRASCISSEFSAVYLACNILQTKAAPHQYRVQNYALCQDDVISARLYSSWSCAHKSDHLSTVIQNSYSPNVLSLIRSLTSFPCEEQKNAAGSTPELETNVLPSSFVCSRYYPEI